MSSESVGRSEQNRARLFHENPFDAREKRYSQPSQNRHQTVQQAQWSKRFWPEEIPLLIRFGHTTLQYSIPVAHRLGLRPGELVHLRWMTDVRPIAGGGGYIVQIQGGRGKDNRCSCRSCGSAKGGAPKNGPREYLLARSADQIEWISPACDALDEWIELTRPTRNDFLFPSAVDSGRAMTNKELNRLVKEAGDRAGIPVGRRAEGSRTAHSFRHACACELLEKGVPPRTRQHGSAMPFRPSWMPTAGLLRSRWHR